MDDYRRLAALAVFRELYDSRKNIYDILREFIIETISSQSLFSFTAARMTAELDNCFGFRVPEAVTKSTLNSLVKNIEWCNKVNGEYIIDHAFEVFDPEVKAIYKKRQDANTEIFDRLINFMNNEMERKLTVEEEKLAIDSLCAFLLNEKHNEAYSQYISSFILKYEGDQQFQSDLNEIREGVILYSGLTYNDKPLEVGSWKNELTLYLDQEILFHCYGLNGDLFRSYFDDFYALVKEINASGKKRLIHLRYFPETKDDIDSFFSTAEKIVSGKLPMHPGNTAMKTIVTGCKRPSDVIEKKTKFNYYLGARYIHLDDSFVFDREKFQHNILSEVICESIEKDLGEKALKSLPILNKVHCLRGSESHQNFYNVKYHFLTGTDATLKAAWHSTIKGDETVPLATYLDWVTNQFWFKLNKGFGGDKLPSHSQALAKARVVLSTVVNRNVGDEYLELLSQYNQGNLSKALVQRGIVDLIERTVRPEEIDTDSIASTLDFLKLDSIERFKAEQDAEEFRKNEQHNENIRLRQELSEKEQETEKLKADLQRHENEKELEEITTMISKQESNKKNADRACTIYTRLSYILTALLLSIVVFILVLFFSKYWVTLEPKVAAFQLFWPIITFLIIVFFGKSITPERIRLKIETKIRNHIYTSHGVDEKHLHELIDQAEQLKKRLRVQR